MEKYIKNNDGNPIILISILTVIWLVYSAVFNNYSYSFGIIFAFFYFILYLFLNTENKYYVLLFTLPFASIFKITSTLPSLLVILVFIYILHVLIIKSIKMNISDYLLLILITLLQFISITFYQGSYINLLSFILNIIFMKICMLNFDAFSNKSRILYNSSYVFGISLFLSIIISDLFPQIPYIVLWEKQTLLMSINRFSGLNGDPNYYNQLVLVSVCLIIASLIKSENKGKWILGILCIFLMLNGFRSVSKSYALSIILVLFMTLYYINKSISLKSKLYNMKALKILLTSTFLFTGIITSITLAQKVVIPVFKARTDTEDILTGRGDIWIHYLKLFYLKPEILISGVGFSNNYNILGEYSGIYMVPHNVYLELLVDCGLVGIFLLFLLFYKIFNNFKYKITSPYYMFFVIILFTSIGLSLSSNDAFFILIPLISLISIGAENHENNCNNNSYTGKWRS